MIHKAAQSLKRRSVLFVCASLIGVSMFIAIYGTWIVDPTHVDWLLVGGDLSQHYLGWEFYRQSEWTLPLGVMQNVAYPHGLSIVFMDSIPLFAIPFKLISGILPVHFQYFGIWGLLAFALQSGIAALIVRRWSNNPLVVLPGAALLTISPVMLERMFNHTALAGHWIILLAILVLVYSRRLSVNKMILFWSLILPTAVMIHPYLLFMISAIFASSLIINYNGLRQLTVSAIIPFTVTMGVFWLLGGFTIKSIDADGLGRFSYDLITPINALGWSRLMPDVSIPIASGESSSYFGAGVLVLVTIGVMIVLSSLLKRRSVNRRAFVAFVPFILLFIAALSPQVHLVGHVLVEYHIPSLVEKVWSIFRASARLAWPLYYMVSVAAIYVIIRKWRKREITISILLVVCVLIQVVDVLGSRRTIDRTQQFSQIHLAEYTSPLDSGYWMKLAENKSHLIYMGSLRDQTFTTLSQYAVDNHLTINTGYFARSPAEKIQSTIGEAEEDLINERSDTNTIYITKEYERVRRLQDANKSINVYHIDGYYVLKSTNAN